MRKHGFRFHSRLKSIPFALEGLKDMLRTQHNAWIHAAFTVGVLGLSFWLRLNVIHFSLMVVAIMLVWVAEAFNTVFEVMADILSPDYSPQIKRAKDIAAAGVLITALGAIFMGLLILGPPLYHRIHSFQVIPFLNLIKQNTL